MSVVPDDHEWQYNPRHSVPDFARHAERAAALSRAVRERHAARYDIAYGDSPLSTLDVFPAATPGAPLHVFLHGGYWRGRDKADYSYVADALVPRGVTTVVMNYDLCPAATLPEIARRTREGLRWIHRNAASLGGDPDRLTVSGHSAGAHLIAMALAEDAGAGAGAGADRLEDGAIKAAVLISGIYELAPVLDITVNETIGLRPEMVDGVSPMRHPPSTATALTVVVGSAETPAWIAQSRDFATLCQCRGSRCSYHTLAGEDHFSIMARMETPDDALSRLVLDAAGVEE
ncbi:alpha/beta hydrolase [Azospirillum brasilense]|uniref:Alpha/beta hydrolase n=1 Tax=Azospirillum brasilense TaxID=192 RepID=A0A6L3AYG2_AZOBR|nr:alpha/beta hydrolase [Azospirillum brasilense]KAA0683780.1 alpha/beta hydrolase [Azospirillum brasilense]